MAALVVPEASSYLWVVLHGMMSAWTNFHHLILQQQCPGSIVAQARVQVPLMTSYPEAMPMGRSTMERSVESPYMDVQPSVVQSP